MAVPNSSFNQLTAVTRRYYVPKMADNIYKARPLLALMRKKGVKINGSSQIIVPVGYKAGLGGSYTGLDTLSSTAQDEISAATYEWKQYYGATVIAGREAVLNAGPHQVVDFMDAKMQIAEGGLLNQLNTDLFSTNGDTANGVGGLRNAVGVSRTLGTIASTSSSNAFWESNVDSSTTALTLSLLATARNACMNNSTNISPDVIVTTSAIWVLIHAFVDDLQRFVDTKTADMGFPNLLVLGIPTFWDNECPASHIFMGSTKTISLYQQSERPIRFDGWRKPTDQDGMIGFFFWMGNVVVSQPRTWYKFSAITS